MNIKWALTNLCNLNCKTCYNANLRNNEKGIELSRSIELISEFRSNNVKSVHLLGGEPLLYEGIENIVLECHKNKIETWINTNAIQLSNTELLNSIISNGLDTLIISLDGFDSDTNDAIRGDGVFEKVIKVLEYIKDTRITKININVVASRAFLKQKHSILDFLCHFGVIIENITISLPDIVGNAAVSENMFSNIKDDYYDYIFWFYRNCEKKYVNKVIFDSSPLLYDYVHFKKPMINTHQNMYCMGGSFTYFLDADGILYPCNLPSGINWFKNNVLGKNSDEAYNLKFNSLKSVLSMVGYQHFFEYVRKRDLDNCYTKTEDICKNCIYLLSHKCNIGCPCSSKPYEFLYLCEKVRKLDQKYFAITRGQSI